MNRPLRIIHVLGGMEAALGGPSYTAPRLAEAQAALGADVELLTIAPGTSRPETSTRGALRVTAFPQTAAATPALSKLRVSLGLCAALRRKAAQADLIHAHGLWQWHTLAAAQTARRSGVPLMLSPRGMLAREALAISPRLKAAFHHAAQKGALRDLACIHATCAAEGAEARAFGLTAPIAVAPNGVDLPALAAPRPRPKDGVREALYLGRLHARKRLDLLLRAFEAARRALGETGAAPWRLRVIGPSEQGCAAELQALAEALDIARHVRIEPPLYGAEKFEALRRADLFISPSPNENFGVAIAEALAAETPAIATHGAPWVALATEGCGWWTAPREAAIAEALSHAMATPRARLERMGAKGRAHVASACAWEPIAARLLEVAAWLRGGACAPAPNAILKEGVPQETLSTAPRGPRAGSPSLSRSAARESLRPDPRP
ncbi:MAG: glycosyltransferase [Pseudomonadota bacterium]